LAVKRPRSDFDILETPDTAYPLSREVLRAPVHQPAWMAFGGLDFSISADDPLMLATDIDDEFAYTHAGLRLQERTGLRFGSVSADEFCRKSAEASCRVSFCVPRSSWGPAPRLIFARQWRSPEPW
jgi:hypothetical protein